MLGQFQFMKSHLLTPPKFRFAIFLLGLGLVCLTNSQAVLQAQESSSEDSSRVNGSQLDDAPPTPRIKPKKKKLDFVKKGGIVYRKFDDLEIKCDVYIPEGDGPFPAVLAVHGGAWRQGTKFALLRHAWRMAQSGYVVVAINYRHAPKYPFPAQVEDCKHAVRWMKANAATYKIDPEKICGFGYSAGGHLVSMLGTTDVGDGLEGSIVKGWEKYDSRLKAVAAGGAPCEFSWIGKNSNVLAYWLGGSPNQKPENYKAASPTTYVTADDPPFYLFHGDSDIIVPKSTSKALYNKLQDAGVVSERSIDRSSGHIATFSDMQWMDKAIEFFDRHVKDD